MDNLNPLLSIIIKCSSTEFLGYIFMFTLNADYFCNIYLYYFFVAH
jgi:hypothetical protein